MEVFFLLKRFLTKNINNAEHYLIEFKHFSMVQHSYDNILNTVLDIYNLCYKILLV